MIYKFKNEAPKISDNAFIAKSSDIIGDVTLEEDSSIWFGAVLRADENSITIKKGTNIQDNCTVHSSMKHSTYIGEYSNIGHNTVIHACKIGNHTLIGMECAILDGAEVGDYTIVGAGSLIPGGKKIPSGVLCLGSPAKVIRELTKEEIEGIKENAQHYIEFSKEYMKAQDK